MKPTFIYIFKIFSLAIIVWFSSICSVKAQEEDLATENTADSIKIDYANKPFGIQVGLDVVKLATFGLDFETKYEGMGGISYKNVGIVLEAGYAQNSSVLAYKNSEDYKVEGKYYRIGLDYSINIGANNQLLLGARYGSSSFSDKGTFIVTSDLWGNFETSVNRSGAEATWGELVLGSQTSILKNLYFGWYFRFRKIFDRTTYAPIDIYYIPGYGKSVNNTVPALNLFFKYRIDF